LALRDPDGITVREAIRRWSGLSPSRFSPAHRSADLLGYVEVHIEQGPVLEAKNLAVGVVSGIAGQTRLRVTLQGKAGHAGTTPMRLRRDALAAAGYFISSVETFAQSHPPLVATVGTIQVSPGAPNVIPGEAVLSVDVRHPEDKVRSRALQAIGQMGSTIMRERKVVMKLETTQDNRAVRCSPELSRMLERSVKAVQGKSVSLVSGAGHDAVVMSAITPVAMLFVRCRDGLSHHPDEYASPKDIRVALEVVVDFLQKVGQVSDLPMDGSKTRPTV
jgi:allantoate deiminase